MRADPFLFFTDVRWKMGRMVIFHGVPREQFPFIRCSVWPGRWVELLITLDFKEKRGSFIHVLTSKVTSWMSMELQNPPEGAKFIIRIRNGASYPEFPAASLTCGALGVCRRWSMLIFPSNQLWRYKFGSCQRAEWHQGRTRRVNSGCGGTAGCNIGAWWWKNKKVRINVSSTRLGTQNHVWESKTSWS